MSITGNLLSNMISSLPSCVAIHLVASSAQKIMTYLLQSNCVHHCTTKICVARITYHCSYCLFVLHVSHRCNISNYRSIRNFFLTRLQKRIICLGDSFALWDVTLKKKIAKLRISMGEWNFQYTYYYQKITKKHTFINLCPASLYGVKVPGLCLAFRI